MNVAILSSLYAPLGYGGAERVAQTLAEALAARGHRVDVITLARDAAATETLNGVRVHRLPLRNLYWPFPVAGQGTARKILWHARDADNAAMGAAVGAKLDALRPELLNTHNLAGFSASVWRAAAGRGLPVVHSLHDHYLLCPYSTMHRGGRNCDAPCLRCRMATAPRRRLSDLVSGAIGVSRYLLERHCAAGLFARARTAVVHGAGTFDTLGTPAQAAPDGPLHVGFLGTLVPGKGLDRLVDAFLALPEGAARLSIAGGGDEAYAAPLRARTAGRADVRWLGVVEAGAFLPSLDLLAVPTLLQEGMGLAAVEALQHGVPVAAARRGGLPEIVGERAGWLFEPERGDELPALLRRLAADPSQARALRAGAAEAGRAFSVDAMVAGYLDAYRAVLPASASR